MSRSRGRPGTPATVLAALVLFLASAIGGAFPAGQSCGGRTLCLCCAVAEGDCKCPPDSHCGCREAVRDLLPPDPPPATGIAAPLPSGAPALPAAAAYRTGDPIPPDRVVSGRLAPETPPPEV